MKFVVSVQLKIHISARDRFATWARQHGQSFKELKAKIEHEKGHPVGAIEIENGRWIWAEGGTFVSYVIKDEPVDMLGHAIPLRLFVRRFIIVTDIFAVGT